MNVRPILNKVLVFSVPARRRYINAKGEISKLFVGNEMRGAYERCEEVWIIAFSNDAKFTLVPGTKAFVSDAFEMEPTDLDLWEEMKDNPWFAGLAKFVRDVEGTVRTKIIHEMSLLAYEDA